MKKSLLGLAGVVLTGGIIGASYFSGEEQPKEVEKTMTATETTQPITITAPVERTVNTNGQYPWNTLVSEAVEQEVNNGGQVFLMTDAEPLENAITDFLANADKATEGPYDPKKIAASWGNQLALFVQDLEEFYPDNQDYFLKLSELSVHLKNADITASKTALEQVKVLR